MTTIGITELRENTEDIARRVHAGEYFTVISGSRPLFNIVRTENQPNELSSWLDTYIDKNRSLLEVLAEK